MQYCRSILQTWHAKRRCTIALSVVLHMTLEHIFLRRWMLRPDIGYHGGGAFARDGFVAQNACIEMEDIHFSLAVRGDVECCKTRRNSLRCLSRSLIDQLRYVVRVRQH